MVLVHAYLETSHRNAVSPDENYYGGCTLMYAQGSPQTFSKRYRRCYSTGMVITRLCKSHSNCKVSTYSENKFPIRWMS